MADFLSDFEPSCIVGKDGVDCYHCEKKSWIFFNKNDDFYDYENEYCWDCFRKEISIKTIEVKIND